jgi:hypothetical protein
MIVGSVATFKLLVAIVLYLFLPLAALTYYFSTRKRRAMEVERTLAILAVEQSYAKAYRPDTTTNYVWAVGYASVISWIGLVLLFFSSEIGLLNGEFPTVMLAGVDFPHEGSRVVFAMAFLGAYLSGLQHIYRRYAAGDLSPAVYFGFSMRMIFAAVVVVVVYNAFSALSGGVGSDGGITANIWPALAFLMGIFPERGMRYLTDKVPLLSQGNDTTVRPAPLEMIEGIESHDILRLEEIGVDTCYDLATADFVPLLLKTPYSARQLIDWILQAKLCVHVGAGVKDLRQLGIRTVVDLEPLTPEEVEALPQNTSVTASALGRAIAAARNSSEIARLREAGQLLGMFWGRLEPATAVPSERQLATKSINDLPRQDDSCSLDHRVGAD